eukprot:scaffold2357_cov108-Cylindrotheca_fusiformis.AAC.3
MFSTLAGNNERSATFGFRNNGGQLFIHFILAVLIGVTLKLTIFKDALLAASSTSSTHTEKTSFLIPFGFTKAFSNLAVGRISDLHGRKLPHCFGWIAGICLGCLLLAVASRATDDDDDDTLTWYVIANIFLGAQQGWTWTTNIFMFLDVLGPDNRALASGISNSVGYLSSAITAYAAAALSVQDAFHGVLWSSVAGLVISLFVMKDTSDFVRLETSSEIINPNSENEDAETQDDATADCVADDELGEKWNESSQPHEDIKPDPLVVPPLAGEYELVSFSSKMNTPSMTQQQQQQQYQHTSVAIPSSFIAVLRQTCWNNSSTAILLISGLMTNLITSLAWGLVIIWARQQSLSEFQVANISSAFTFSKAFMMILASRMSDTRHIRKPILVGGFLTTMVGLIITALADYDQPLVAGTMNHRIYWFLLVGGIIIGCGIGSVYCVMAGAMSDHTPAVDRACAIGIYKLWRDSGYAVGGLLTGILADVFHGSFVMTTLIVTGMVGILVLCLVKYYHEGIMPPPPHQHQQLMVEQPPEQELRRYSIT